MAEHREPTAPSAEQLIARLESATEGSRRLDSDIYLAVTREKDPEELIAEARAHFGREPSDTFKAIHRDAHFRAIADPPPYTASLDTAMTLLPKEAYFEICSRTEYDPRPNARVCVGDLDISDDAATPPLAVCIAALKARQAVPPTGRVELGERSNTDPQPDTTSATPPSPPAVVEYTTPDAPPSSAEKIRECSCHPDDSPPQPCPHKFAYGECVKTALMARLREPEAREAIKQALEPYLHDAITREAHEDAAVAVIYVITEKST